MAKWKNVYVAGPLFNRWQVELLVKAEEGLEQAGFNCFKPREASGGIKPDTPTRAATIFNNNVHGLQSCGIVLAVLDYRLPPGMKLQLHKDEVMTKEVRLADNGTVWEMGWAFSREVPVVGLTESPDMPLNVMLTQGCKGILHGTDALADWAKRCEQAGDWKFDLLAQWRGGHL